MTHDSTTFTVIPAAAGTTAMVLTANGRLEPYAVLGYEVVAHHDCQGSNCDGQLDFQLYALGIAGHLPAPYGVLVPGTEFWTTPFGDRYATEALLLAGLKAERAEMNKANRAATAEAASVKRGKNIVPLRPPGGSLN